MTIRKKHIKILICLILVYQHFYADAFGQIPFLLIGLYIALDVAFIIFNHNKFHRIRLSDSRIWLVFFMGYAALFGYFITSYRNAFIGYIVNSVEYVILLLTVCEIVKKEKQPDFFIVTIHSISLAGILLALFRQQYIFNRLVISLHSNANTLGNLCILCVCTGIYIALRFKKGWFAIVFSMPIAFYAAILTASKKALLISALVLLLFILFRYKTWLKAHFLEVVVITALIIIVVLANRYAIVHAWENTTIYSRIQRTGEIDLGRLLLYQEAIDVFKQHPLFGVGYQCFQFYSSYGLYSHSAYAEVLSGTGIIGMLLWGVFYFGALFKSFHLAFRNKNNTVYLWSFVWLICQMILDFTSVSLYSPINMALFGVVIAMNEMESINIGSAI